MVEEIILAIAEIAAELLFGDTLDRKIAAWKQRIVHRREEKAAHRKSK